MIIEFLVKQKKFAQVFTILMLIIGFLSFSTIQRNQFPNVDFEVMTIHTSYPNSSPLDVEEDVTNLIEDKLKTISGIEFYTSLSKEGLSRVTIRIDQDSDDIDQVKQDIRTEVTGITDFPDDVTPRIVAHNTTRQEAIRVNLAGDYDMFSLENIAKNLKDKIEQIKGVSEVNEDGNVDREIKIFLKPELLKKYRLSLEDIAVKVQNRHYRYTAGDNNNPVDNNNIVVLEKFKTEQDIKNLIVKANFEGQIIYLKDIADIALEPAEISDILRVNLKTGYELKVHKAASADILDTTDAIKAVVDKFKDNYGDKLEIFYTNDQSKYVRNRLEIVSNNALIGFIAVIIILGIFLSIRTAFWVSVGMTVVLVGIVILLLAGGHTINLISLAAVILVLGLVVDDSIIVAESIEEAKERENTTKSIAGGYRRVIKPVITTILTSVIAMSSMFLMEGTMGKFIYVIPMVIIFALSLSFIEITFALPAHLNNNKTSAPRMWFHSFEVVFEKFVYYILRFKYPVILLFTLLLAGSFYFALKHMEKTMFPAEGADVISARLKTDNSFDLDKTSEVSLKVEQVIMQTLGKNLEFISSDVGGSSPNRSSIDIRLIPVVERNAKAPEIMDELKAATKDIEFVKKLDFSVRRPGPPQGGDIEIVVIGNDNIQREAASQKVKEIMQTIDGVSDIDLDNDEGKKRLQVIFDFEKMARLGVNFATVRNILSATFSGVKIAETRRGDIDIDYRVFLGKDSQIDIIDKLTINNNQGRVLPLSEFVNIKSIAGESDYNHYNGKRSITISATLNDAKTNALEVGNQVKELLNSDVNYPGVLLVFEGGGKDQQQSMQSFAKAFGFATIIIYLVLIVLFNSWTQPLIIVSVIPFAFVGVIWAFYFHGEPISFFTMLGSLALIGVVVNDSLVMVSHLNDIRQKSKDTELREWIARGSKDRLRAVILTSITTLVGVMPLAYGIGGVDIFLQPMVLALGYGLLFATVITLILTPCFYMMNYQITSFFARLMNNKKVKSANQLSA
jgi:multidrug efflux pump subunit AcrB